MRSRLEARWAAFFDLLKWQWSYEPVDLAGYIPDFVLRFGAGPLAVEVKPEVELDSLRVHAQRIVWSGWRKELLAVGAGLFGSANDPREIGLIGDRDDGEIVLCAAHVFRCIICGEISVHAAEGSWRCRRCGASDGHVGELEPGELLALWNNAGNRVQWKGPEAAE